MKRVCIFGAGAIGSFLGVHLVNGGECEVSVVARGEHLRAIRRDGIRLESPQRALAGRPHAATDEPSSLPPQDIVFVTLKAMAQSPNAAAIAALLKPDGHAVFVGNGIPWWWKHGLAAPGPLPLVDADGALWHGLGAGRVVGCVVYSGNELVAPGVVRNSGNNRWLLGEPAGGDSERLQATIGLMARAGLGAEAAGDIRRELWAKLLRNVTSNPLCAITGLSIDRMAAQPGLMELAGRLLDEVTLVARSHGSDVADEATATRESLRYGGGRAAMPFVGMKPSMLQDVLAGRSLEVEAILGQVQVLAGETATPTPVLDVLLPLVRGLDAGIAQR